MKKHPCFQEVVGFNDRWLIIVGLPLASVLISLLLFSESYTKEGIGFITVCMAMSFAHTAIFWFWLRWVYFRSKIRYPRFEQIGSRLTWFLVAFLAIYFILNKGLVLFFDAISNDPDRNDPNHVLSFISAFLMSALLIVIYEAMSFYLQLQQTVAEKAILERQNVESQLEGLRNQVNPHFLFNILNSIYALAIEKSDDAPEAVVRLSGMMRYITGEASRDFVPLEKELDYIRNYIELQQIRFGATVRVEYVVEGDRKSVV